MFARILIAEHSAVWTLHDSKLLGDKWRSSVPLNPPIPSGLGGHTLLQTEPHRNSGTLATAFLWNLINHYVPIKQAHTHTPFLHIHPPSGLLARRILKDSSNIFVLTEDLGKVACSVFSVQQLAPLCRRAVKEVATACLGAVNGDSCLSLLWEKISTRHLNSPV